MLVNNFIYRREIHQIVLFSFWKIKITNKRRQSLIGLSFVLLWIVGYLVFALYPMGHSLYLSFFKVRMDGSSLQLLYHGIENYKAAFLIDERFVDMLLQYVLQTAMNVPITIVFALVIAMLINQDIKGKGIWRTIFFLPVIIISGPVIQELLNQGATTLPSIQEYRLIGMILDNLNPALAAPIQALFDRILLVLWFAGIQILIFLAGLQKIDKEIYEASMIDGAGPWESFWKITLPSLMPLISVTIIYTVVSMSVFSLNEVIIYIRNVMRGESTVGTVINGMGYSAALAWIYFLVMSLLIIIFIGLINIRKRSKS
ncbi:MAG: sugar ABC transporter permease [Bacilli bacterium]|nr:sugar ABC transporter permease [Bacilli bacterium]MBN2696022.1 sugar ABC transporter permease [Bacilli bacterium]